MASGLGTEAPLAELLDGTLVPFAQLEVLACDAVFRRLVLDPVGEPLDVGQDERTFTKGLRQVVMVRDRHCQWPGCTMRAQWCEVHHLVFWRSGGATSSDNAICLCSFHHHEVHRAAVAILETPGGFRFVTAEGRRIGESTRLDDELLVPRPRTPSVPRPESVPRPGGDDGDGGPGRGGGGAAVGVGADGRGSGGGVGRAAARAGAGPASGCSPPSGVTASTEDQAGDGYEFPDGRPAALW